MIILCLSLLISTNAFAQIKNDSLAFTMNLKWKSRPFELNKTYVSTTDTLQINVTKFYISGIEIQYENGNLFKEKNIYHLIDIENYKPFFITKKLTKTISKVSFNIGIDSTASVSGALSGALDISKGMYWAWQSGYINLKIEGKSKSCKTRNNKFQFHIGGYLKPNYALRRIELYPNQQELNINLDLSKLFDKLELSETNSVMIPGSKAIQIANLSATMFSLE